MAPLARAAAALRARGETPDFDPLDGGIAARVLLLLEKPGPMTSPSRGGSGFVSRDNDDPTAEAVHRFAAEAGLPRRETLIWNIVPWWNGTTAVTAREMALGIAALSDMLILLPRLHTVILVGRRAARARPMLGRYRLVESAHPSPNVRAAFPDRWSDIPRIWLMATSEI